MTPEHPSRLGRYELLEVLGRGAMGVVYKAHDSFLDRVVAVKTYRQDIAINENVRRRFEREVRTASRLIHPNIVTVYDGGLEGDTPFLAMEFIEGTTLEHEIERQGRLPVAEALRILQQVNDGLAYAHAQSVIHRDLKPANILLSKGGTAKIADFGVAKLMTADTGATINPVGTPSYMSPEQVSGLPVDVRADVFALGILGYQLLTGSRPFEGDTWTAVLFQILNAEPQPPSVIAPDLPRGIDDVLARALHKDVARRTPDVATFQRELREVFDRAAASLREQTMSGGARRGRPRIDDDLPRTAKRGSEGFGDDDPHLPIEPGDLEAFRGLAQPVRPERRVPIWAIAVILVGLGLIAVLVAVLSGRQREPSPPPLATPEAEATGAVEVPTVAPPTIAPTVRPARTVRPTVAPTLRPTLAPTLRPTAPPTPRPTIPPTVPPTVPPQPTIAPPPTVAPPTPVMVPTAAPIAGPPAEVAPAGDLAVMDVISTPARADVLVDGEPRGRTPIRIADLPPGRHAFEVRKEGHTSYRRELELEGRSRYEMKVTLVAIVNSLRVLSEPPGADVRLNGEARGRTPLLLSELPDGRYEVEAVVEGHAPQRSTVELQGGRLEEIRFRFGAPQ